jgi:hypothetical protein
VVWPESSDHRHCGHDGKNPIIRQGNTNRKVSMYQLHDLRANGPLFVGDKLSATYPVMLSRRARPMAARPRRSSPCFAKLLDTVMALPSVHRAYQREGFTDDIC